MIITINLFLISYCWLEQLAIFYELLASEVKNYH